MGILSESDPGADFSAGGLGRFVDIRNPHTVLAEFDIAVTVQHLDQSIRFRVDADQGPGYLPELSQFPVGAGWLDIRLLAVVWIHRTHGKTSPSTDLDVQLSGPRLAATRSRYQPFSNLSTTPTSHVAK